jgi:hypothetical protein
MDPQPGRHISLDISAIFAASDRRAQHRRAALFVTDLTSSEWCQVQTAFNLQLPKARTEAMRLGSERHQQLEEQVHQRVEVEVASPEDAFATRLLNMAFGLRCLLDTGVTRELPVQAKVGAMAEWLAMLLAGAWA